MTTAYFSFDQHFMHDTGTEHPEHAMRILAIEQALKKFNLWSLLDHRQGEPAQLSDIIRAHSPGYVEELQLISPANGHIMVDEDTVMSAGTLEAALIGAGSTVMALDGLIKHEFDNAFVATRPPGHHAERRKAMGFSFFNNIAIAALRAAEVHHLQRIVIIDFDVHQCNGTIDILKNDPRFLILSSFQHPFYPFSHYQLNKFSNLVNIYLDAGSHGDSFRQGVREVWKPALQSFAPELILVSAGFDAHNDDPMSEMCFNDDDYRWIARWIARRAKERNTPWLAALEGGYDLNALGRCVSEFIEQMVTQNNT